MAEPIPLEAFYDLSLPSTPAVSPDGEHVAFLVRESDHDADRRRSSLFVAPADGSREPHRLTRASDANAPIWSPDGTKLAFTATREMDVALAVGRDEAAGDDGESTDESDDDENGETGDVEGPRPQVWVFDMDRGGDARQVTDFEEGVREFDWGPDGERIVVSARDPTAEEQEYLEQRREDDGPIETERLHIKAEGTGWLDTVTTYLFVVDCDTGDARKLEDAAGRGGEEPYVGLQPAWGPGERIAFVTNASDRPDDSLAMDVHTIAPDGSDLRRHTEEMLAFGLSWSPDGARLAFDALPDAENSFRPVEAHVLDVTTDETCSVSASLDRTLGWGGVTTWLDDETMVALVGDEGWTRPVRLHVDGDPERVFDRLPRDETLTGMDAAGGTVALVRSHPAEGADVYAMTADALDASERDDDPRTRLSTLNGELVGAHDLPETTRLAFESEGGESIEAVCYHPPGFDPDDPEPLPTVFIIHGGPTTYDEPSFGFDEAVYTSRGYLVVEVNYRGSTSYGRAFSEYLRGNLNTMDAGDLKAGVDAVVDRGWADPDRLFCTGFSGGGTITAYMITQTDHFAAAAAEHGIYDLRSNYATSDIHNWYDTDYGPPWEAPEDYDHASAITEIGEVDTPLLVTAGGQDWGCPSSQSEQLYVSVRKQGVPARLVVYPDERHTIGDPDRAVHRLEELTTWFDRFDPANED